MAPSPLKQEGGGHDGDREVAGGQEVGDKMVKLEVGRRSSNCRKPCKGGQ